MEFYLTYFFGIFSLFCIVGTQFIFPKFYVKIRENKLYDLLFRIFIFILLIISQTVFYITYLTGKDLTEWKSYIYLEFCNIEAFLIIILILIPNKFMLECALPMGIMGAAYTVMFPVHPDLMEFNNLRYWQLEFGHIIMMFSYFYLYNFAHTSLKLNKTFIIRGILFTIITGMAIEIYNLAFHTNFLYSQTGKLFLGKGKKEIVYFLFTISWIFPLTMLIAYFITWVFKPIYSYEFNMKITDTWFEKLVKYIKTKKKIRK